MMTTPKGHHGPKGKEEKKGKEDSLLDYAPSSITIDDYVESRAREVMLMVKKYKSNTSHRTAMQHLPRHMRRRAASHNVKRLPRRVREQARVDISGLGAPVQTKRPSRKHRRKPSNLMTEYVRRQKRCIWLETHLWHAKRFHMKEEWGYKVPLHPNDKSARASYRANNHFCIMQDVSYWCCIEMRGPQQTLVTSLNKMTSKEAGPSVEAVVFLSGAKEGRVILYEVDQYPHRAVGPAQFLWCPERQDGNVMTSHELKEHPDRQRKMWLWVHPSCYDIILAQICKAMEFPDDCVNITQDTTFQKNYDVDDGDNGQKQEMVSPSKITDSDKGVKRKAEENGNAETKSKRPKTDQSVDPRSVVLPIVAHFKHEDKELISLKDNLVRFRLSGPLSNTVLTDLLIPAKTNPLSPDQREEWWRKYFGEEVTTQEHVKQSEVWRQISTIQSPGELAAGCVLGLTVRDPRILLPVVRNKVFQRTSGVAEQVLDICKKWPLDACASPLWDEEVRNLAKTTKVTDAKMNSLRSQQLVPGSTLDLGDEESRIPVILIQTPGCRPTHDMVRGSAETGSRHSPGWGSGWDIILPSGWAMPFWVGLIYRGARTAGLREELQLSQEMGVPCFPHNFPDTDAGQQSEQATRTELEAKYNRMPPAKRANYIKLGTVAPFYCPWTRLLRDWTDSKEHGEILKCSVLRNRKTLQSLHKVCLPQQKSNSREEVSLVSMPPNALIPVQVIDMSRGVPQNFSMICLPSDDDFQKLSKNKSNCAPTENMHSDPTKVKDKNKSKRKTEEKKLGPLEFPVKSVRHSCEREILGYVSHGGFCLSSGKGAGMGFVAAQGLQKLLQETAHDKQTVVLVRAPHSLQYRFAYLNVNLTQ